MTLDSNIRTFCDNFHQERTKYVNFALRFVRDRAAVEDLINDSFVTFWERRESLAADTVCEAYFYTIVKNRCLNYLRDMQTRSKIRDDLQDTTYRLMQYDLASLESYNPNLIFSSEIQQILDQQLRTLPELTRSIFRDNRFEHMTYEEIARKYDISVWKVAREIQTALQVLRHALKDYLPMLVFLLLLRK